MRALLALIVVAAIAVAIFFATAGPTDVDNEAAKNSPEPAKVDTQDPENHPTPLEGGNGEDRIAMPDKVEPPPTQTEARAPQTQWGNRIEGEVVDANKNPVRGAQVTLTLYPPGALFLDQTAGRVADQKLQTNDEGKFTFDNLHPDKYYTIIAWHPDQGRRMEGNLRVEKDEQQPLLVVLEPGATLSGTVTGPGGVGLSDVEVTLSFTSVGSDDAAGTLKTTSDAVGKYSFPNVGEGNYQLSAWADGFGRANVGPLNLSGSEVTTRDIVLEAAHLIQGTVTAMDGSPIVGAEVEAISQLRTGGTPATRTTKLTDETGTFTFDDVPQGSYNLNSQANGYRRGVARGITTGDLNVQIQCETEPSITGHVRLPDGTPLKNFTVQLRTRMANSDQTIPVRNQRFKITDSEDGAYLVSCPRPGEYEVEAINPEFAPSFSELVMVERNSRQTADITMKMGGLIRGKLVDKDGPVAGARVNSYHTDFVPNDPFFEGIEFPGSATKAATVSAEDGTFELRLLNPATYQVHVLSGDHAAFTERQVVVIEGQEKDLGNLNLSQGGKLVGQVTDASGAGLSGVVVALNFDAAAVGRQFGANYSGRTDANGNYTFDNLPPGPYQVYAQRRVGNDVLSNVEDINATRRSTNIVDGGSTTENFTLND